MGLHHIMVDILKEEGPMRPADLAEHIRMNELYNQKDGTPLKNQQIYARVSNNPNLFKIENSMVMLQDENWDYISCVDITTKMLTGELKVKAIFEDITVFSTNPKEDWFYESKISSALVEYFEMKGYKILKDNSDNIQSKGIDIIVEKDGIRELIEVKGYPSLYYVNKNKQDQIKKTSPYLQSTHWFDGCLSSTIKNHKENSLDVLAMAFPACARYEQLMYIRQPFFTDNNNDIKIYFVKEDGSVVIDNMNRRLGINRE